MGGSKTKPKKKTNHKNKQKQHRAANTHWEEKHEAEAEFNENSASANTISQSSSDINMSISNVSVSGSVSGNESESESNTALDTAHNINTQEQAQLHANLPVKRRLDSELQAPNIKTNLPFEEDGEEDEENKLQATEDAAEHLKRVCIDSKEKKENAPAESESGLEGNFVFERPVSGSENIRTIQRVDSKYSEQNPLPHTQNPPANPLPGSSQIAETDAAPASFSVLDGFSSESSLYSASTTSETPQQLSPTLEPIAEETDIPAAKTTAFHLEPEETGTATDFDASCSSADDLDSEAFSPLLGSEKLSSPSTSFVYLPAAVAQILKRRISPLVKAIAAKTDAHPLLKWLVIVGSAPIGLWLCSLLLPFALGGTFVFGWEKIRAAAIGAFQELYACIF
ncbi:hypothetical protein HK100_012385 [Physocladia obscura]|uniref:Uncharacterized protein n=1 Tax=Physocladia obscura TaxID=109957 RepID=A0AAD5SZV0_9FUNG|nr:hypothetical protein HK100_012385 [Physocladia obscura]